MNIACVGAGYFAQYHVEAWDRLPEVNLVALCDLDFDKAAALANKYKVTKVYTDIDKLLAEEDLDIIDLITPPETHLGLCRKILENNLDLICQKPLAPSLEEAKAIVQLATVMDRRFMVHENFRFQPWYRKLKSLLNTGAIGEQLHTLNLLMRMGDGWGPDAYLDRQPYFQTMPRLLIYETGIHYIDVFRYLAGDITHVYARLRKLNPVIAGEDCGLVVLDFKNGGLGIIDGNRYNDSRSTDPRYTFGETTIEGNAGTLRLYSNGTITLQKLGEREVAQTYEHNNKNFASDCVYHTQRHFVQAYLTGDPFETNGRQYLKNIRVQDAIYQSSLLSQPIPIDYDL